MSLKPPGNPNVPLNQGRVLQNVMEDNGARGDGTADDTSAIQAAVTSVSGKGGGIVFFPAGTYKLTSALSVPNFVCLQGVGQSSILRCGGNHYAINFNPGNRSAVSSLQIDASSVQSSGGGLDYTNAGSNVMVDHVYFGSNLFRSIQLTPNAARAVFMFNRLRWNGVTGCNTAIYVGDGTNLCTDIHFTDVVGTASTGTDMVTWIDLAKNVDTFTMTQALCIKGGTGMLLGSRGASGLTTGAKFSQTVMDTMDGIGVDLATVRDIDFSVCSIQTCGSATLAALRVGATVTGMRWTAGIIQGNRGDGVLIKNGSLYTKLIGSQISDNNTGNTASLNGITVEANASQWDVINCDIGNNVVLATGHQKTGISVPAGTSNLFTIVACDISRNETAPFTDASSGQIKTIWGNKALDAAGTASVAVDHWTNSNLYVRDGLGVERIRLANPGFINVIGQFAANYLMKLNAVSGQSASIVQFMVNSVLKSCINHFGEFVSDDNTKGIVLKDTQGTPHYWRVTVSTTGVLTTADLGTTRPD